MEQRAMDTSNYSESEKKQTEIMYDTIIRPFMDPFADMFINSGPKLVLGAITLISMIIATLADLIQTPAPYWIGLMGLALIDFIAGTFRALVDSKIKWSWGRWVRSAYKFTAYPVVLICTSVVGNMFPLMFGWVQYVVVSMLVGMEMYSILRNLKMVAVISVLMDVAQKRGLGDWRNIKQAVDNRDDELMKERHRKYFRQMRDKDKENDR